VDLLLGELLSTPKIIDVIRVAPINKDVPRLEMRFRDYGNPRLLSI